MKKRAIAIFPNLSVPLVGAFLILITTIAVGFYVGSYGISYKDFMVLGALIIIGAAIVLGDRGINMGYICWILMFGLGYRTVRFTTFVSPISGAPISQKQDIVLHPLLLIFFLLGLIILRIVIFNGQSIRNSIPRIVWPFSLFWIWGLLVGIKNGLPLYSMIPDFLINFVILIPIFIVVNYVLEKPSYWKLSIRAFFGVATYIAVFGTAEFSIPGFASLIPGFMLGPADTVDILGFHRASFAFWGRPSAIFISLMALPLVLVLFKWHQNILSRAVLVFSSINVVYGLYIAGWRSTWATLAILFLLLALMKRSWKAIIAVVLIISIIYTSLPPEARARFATFTSAVDGDFVATDSSSIKRFRFADVAIQETLANPLGLGWGAVGWVHNDFLQIAADTGMLGAGLFALWYLSTLVRLALAYWKSKNELHLGLFGSFFIAGTLLLTQPMYVATQTIAPIWFIWAMADISLRQIKGVVTNV